MQTKFSSAGTGPTTGCALECIRFTFCCMCPRAAISSSHAYFNHHSCKVSMPRVRCETCGKWGRDRCVCSSKKSTHQQPMKQKSPKPTKQTTTTSKTTTTQEERRLHLQVELAKVQLLQARLEVRKKEKRAEKKEKKKKEEAQAQHARWLRNARWYGKSWWSRHKSGKWWQDQRSHPIDDEFNAQNEGWLSACNDGMN